MKVFLPKSNDAPKRNRRGFTLIEMIGVLAVIAILAAVLIPKVFEAINNARVNNAAMTCNTVKTAIADHYAKAGTLAVDASGANPVVLNLPIEQFDIVPLVKEGFLDKPFAVKIGDGIINAANTRVRAFNANGGTPLTLASVVTAAADTGFNLDGDAGNLNDVVGSVCVEAVITGVTGSDAKDLNDRIDGPSLGTAVNAADLLGRVKFAAANPTTTVYIYLTHR
jgi:prepilin-type N-terminal cleavage/methylation domain-containing protein